jgi:four helix bundle protein
MNFFSAKLIRQIHLSNMGWSEGYAEGSGSFSDKDFANFLNISRRSVFECANILFIFLKRNIITEDQRVETNQKLIQLSKKITNFRKAIATK